MYVNFKAQVRFEFELTRLASLTRTTFDKPLDKQDKDYQDYALEAATKALLDAGVNYDNVEYATAGYGELKRRLVGLEALGIDFEFILVYGDSTYGQRALYQLGLTQVGEQSERGSRMSNLRSHSNIFVIRQLLIVAVFTFNLVILSQLHP
jgi:hypothetical protein